MTPEGIAILTATVALFSALLGWLFKRLNTLENRVYGSELYIRRLWLWSRRLMDLYYRHREPGAPDPTPLPQDARYDDD